MIIFWALASVAILALVGAGYVVFGLTVYALAPVKREDRQERIYRR